MYSFHLILSLFRQQQQPIYVKCWWVWSQQSLQIYFNVTLVNLICSWNQSREQSCVAVCWCQIGVRAELKSPNLVSRELQLSSRSGEPVAANNSIRWNVLSQREQNITKIIGRLKYSNQILLYPWKHRYIISMETPQSRVQSNVAIFIAFLLAGDSKLKLQEERECRLPWAKPYDEYCKAWRGDYEDIERMALQSHLSPGAGGWMKPLNPKCCPGPTLGPQLALRTHIFHPLADTGAGPGWAGPMVSSVNLWPASLPRDRVSHPASDTVML